MDRLLLLNVCPKEGNIVNMRTVKKMLDDIGFSDEEQRDWKIITRPNGQVTWDNKVAKDKEVSFSDVAVTILKSEIKKLDEQKKISVQLIGVLLDKFPELLPEEKPNEESKNE